MTRSYSTHSEDQTIALGVDFGKTLSRGNVVALFGDLGTGKTRFIKGMCKGLGVKEHVASPTFTIVNEYQGSTFMVYHFDFYRIQSLAGIRDIGVEEYLAGDGVCVIEWADRIQHILPLNRFDIRLQLGNDEQARVITIEEIAGVAA